MNPDGQSHEHIRQRSTSGTTAATRRRRLLLRTRVTTPAAVVTTLTLLPLLMLALLCLTQTAVAQKQPQQASHDEYAEFVQQVVDEDQEAHHDMNDHATMSDEQYERQQQELLHRKQAEEERIRQQQEAMEQQRNQRVQQEREAAFEAELAQISDDKQKAAVKKQKKRDAAIVQRVLRSAAKGNHYAVLGLRNNREFHFPANGGGSTATRLWKLLHLPQLVLGHVSAAHIKRAYRERAKATHPDKNRDGGAVEAFHAVEHAATVLLDANARAAYDAAVLEQRQLRRTRVYRTVHGGWERCAQVLRRVKSLFGRLGPLALPLSILGVLIF